jgi:uncharacterized protein (TIGR00255 family)
MTGFGRGEASADGIRLTVEIKTVNHRYFSSSMRLPREHVGLEQRLTAHVKQRVERGHAALSFDLVWEGGNQAAHALNRELAQSYLAALQELRRLAGSEARVDLAQVLSLPGMIERTVREGPDERVFLMLATSALDQALDDLVALREQEGARLAEDLNQRLGEIERAISRIAELAPAREVRERGRLTAKLADLGTALDAAAENRILQEVALLADRVDISEELTRFRAHAALFRDTLAAGGPAGRQLTFVLQEMLREVNTMGSKAADSRISQEVIVVKNELEKLREQAENIE